MSNKKERIDDKTLCAEYEAVYHYTLSLCRDESLAQDITQEAFLKAMKHSDTQLKTAAKPAKAGK